MLLLLLFAHVAVITIIERKSPKNKNERCEEFEKRKEPEAIAVKLLNNGPNRQIWNSGNSGTIRQRYVYGEAIHYRSVLIPIRFISQFQFIHYKAMTVVVKYYPSGPEVRDVSLTSVTTSDWTDHLSMDWNNPLVSPCRVKRVFHLHFRRGRNYLWRNERQSIHFGLLAEPMRGWPFSKRMIRRLLTCSDE